VIAGVRSLVAQVTPPIPAIVSRRIARGGVDAAPCSRACL